MRFQDQVSKLSTFFLGHPVVTCAREGTFSVLLLN